MRVVLGIDGGGTSSAMRVRGLDHALDLERAGGPLNVTTLAPEVWRGELDRLLAHIPEPTTAAVCLAGMRTDVTRGVVEMHLRSRFPSSRLRLEPDYVAALGCFDEPVALCVIAGTGSIVCSRSASGAIRTSGGEGYSAGDRGSALRLGERALRTSGMRAANHATPASIAAWAPTLTRRADDGDSCAMREVSEEMSLLAAVVAQHLASYVPPGTQQRVGLVGSVWTSPAARAAFADALDDGSRTVSFVPAVRRPLDAALELAQEQFE